jgi:hypothetical protein
MLLQVFFSVRSERQLMEQIHYNMFRWFIGLAIDDAVRVPTVFSKNRERLIAHDAVIELFNLVLAGAEQRNLLSGEHISVVVIRLETSLDRIWKIMRFLLRFSEENQYNSLILLAFPTGIEPLSQVKVVKI